jgi:hypothetical protein
VKVLSCAGVHDIEQRDIPRTLTHFSELSDIPTEELVLLGSTGKTAKSGDIDIAVDDSKYCPEELHQLLLDQLGSKRCYYNPGTRVGSYAVNINGDAGNGVVQVDLMYVKSVDWAKFAYFSPGDKSDYKGAIRAILLSAIAGTINDEGIDAFVYDEEGELLVRAGWGFYLPVGMKRMYQMRGISKKTGLWLKTMKNVSPDEILDKFPILKFNQTNIVLDDPTAVVRALFGPGVEVSEVESAEDIIWQILLRFTIARQKQIFEVAKKRAADLKGKMTLPPELS